MVCIQVNEISYNADLWFVPGTAAGTDLMNAWLEQNVARPNYFTQGTLIEVINNRAGTITHTSHMHTLFTPAVIGARRVFSDGPIDGGCTRNDLQRESKDPFVIRPMNLKDWVFDPQYTFGMALDPVAVHTTGTSLNSL